MNEGSYPPLSELMRLSLGMSTSDDWALMNVISAFWAAFQLQQKPYKRTLIPAIFPDDRPVVLLQNQQQQFCKWTTNAAAQFIIYTVQCTYMRLCQRFLALDGVFPDTSMHFADFHVHNSAHQQRFLAYLHAWNEARLIPVQGQVNLCWQGDLIHHAPPAWNKNMYYEPTTPHWEPQTFVSEGEALLVGFPGKITGIAVPILIETGPLHNIIEVKIVDAKILNISAESGQVLGYWLNDRCNAHSSEIQLH